MSDLRKAAQMAVVMLRTGLPEYDAMDVLCVLEDALAQPEQEPVAWMYYEDERVWLTMCNFEAQKCATHGITPLYEHPPQRQPLTDEEIHTVYATATNQTLRSGDEKLALAFARAIESAHGIGDGV